MASKARRSSAHRPELAVTPDMWGVPSSVPATAPDDRGAWFREARFAMFIHWGLYSHLAGVWKGKPRYIIGEWIQHHARIPAAEYARTARRFNPVDFDARNWVRLAKDAGMRYVVITAKHHDGFAMFRSAASPFNIVDATPFGRDPLAELADACREADMPLGFYYSQTQDWHEPEAVGNSWDTFGGAPKDFGRYLKNKAIPQIEELLTNYGPVGLIWFDTPGPIGPEHSRTLMERIRQLQPQCLVNSRIGNGLGDYETLGDQEFPRLVRPGLWETIDTHNDTWGFVRHDHNWKSPREIVERLIRIVSRGGNYMLNVGPDGLGRVPEMSANILREVGQWLRVHGEAIYGTDPSPLGAMPWGECTAREGRLYLHVLRAPADGRLIVPGLAKVRSVKLMGSRAKLATRAIAGGTEILLPPSPSSALVPVIAVDIAGKLAPPSDPIVLDNCPYLLVAPAARGQGFRQGKRSWMEKFGDWKHVECLSDWEPPRAKASWDFATLQGGRFYVDVEYSSVPESDYCEWRMRLGESDVTFPLMASGHCCEGGGHELARFRTYRVGLFELPKGPQTLSLSPTRPTGGPVYVSAVILTPQEVV